jgi:hypothetical protein
MTEKPVLAAEAATELHNRVAKQIVAETLNETRAAGGSCSDLLLICESVLVGVVVLQARSRCEGSRPPVHGSEGAPR